MEIKCPCCGNHFFAHYGVQGAPEDEARELYCSEECRDRAEELENRRSAARAKLPSFARASRWKAPESFPWDSTDPFAE